MRQSIVVALAALLVLLSSQAVVAHNPFPCGPAEVLVERLKSKYKEQVVAQGVTGGGALFQIYASQDGATWTALLLVATQEPHMACILSSGEGWQRQKPIYDLTAADLAR